MRYNPLGSTGLFVSELCLGTMTFGASGPYSALGTVAQADADAFVARALEAGINFIDTADTYSEGASERITGQALKNIGVRRDEVVIATKAFGETGPGPNQKGSSRSHLIDGVKASLARLQLDHIDLYQLHGFDPATPIDETLRALDDLVRQGWVRYIGVSNWAAWQIAKALGVSREGKLARFASVQAYYTLAGRDVERELVPMAQSEGLGLLVWSPLAGGLLGKKPAANPAASSHAGASPASSATPPAADANTMAGTRREAIPFPPVEAARAEAVLGVLAGISDRNGASVAQLAIAWLLHQRHVTSVILGARRLAQLEDNLGAVDVAVSAEDLHALDNASRLPAEYPGWMLAMWSQGRTAQLAASRGGEPANASADSSVNAPAEAAATKATR